MVELSENKEVRRGETGRITPGGRFGMLIRNMTKIEVKSLLLVILACTWAALGCAGGAGGKGLSSNRSPGATFGDTVSELSGGTESESAEYARIPAPNVAPVLHQALSANDPFGKMPVDWPESVQLHPSSAVAHSGEFGSEGYYLVTLISPDIATIPGVQAFHIESLSTWESMQIEESEGENTEQLIIIAEQPGSYVKILSEQASTGFLVTLENSEYWQERVGSNPIVVRIFFSAVPPSG